MSIKKFFPAVALLLLAAAGAMAQTAGAGRRGFSLQRSFSAQLDGDPQSEEVQLWGCDNGHWPRFDIFRQYVAVIDSATGEIEYLSPAPFLTDVYNLEFEPVEGGRSRLTFSFIKAGSLATDPIGYDMTCERCPAVIEWTPDSGYRLVCDEDAIGDNNDSWALRMTRSSDPRIITPPASPVPAAKVIKVIMIAGQDGSHWWKGGCEAMKQILESSGLFSVDFCFTPGWDGDMSTFDPDFSSYDLAVINWGGVEWPDKVKRAFEDFVGGGKGAVFFHSSMVPHENWPAWCEMTGLGAWNGRDEKWGPKVYYQGGRLVRDEAPGYAGYHGLQHETVVDNRAMDHPIIKGLPASWRHSKDEIYLEMRGPAKNMEILATTHDRDKDFPVMWTVLYGKGRVFVDVQGHCGNDPEMVYSMTCAGFQTTFLRGCEWAARGIVTQDVPADFPTRESISVRSGF